MCYLCETGAPTTVREFSNIHFQAMSEAIPVGDVAKELDVLCPTKIGHDVVYRLIQRPGFIGVWRKTESEDSDIPYELELAYRLLRVHNSALRRNVWNPAPIDSCPAISWRQRDSDSL